MLLQFSDGVTTVTLSGDGGGVRGCTYFPATPDRRAGGWQDVTESAEVNLRGAAADVRGVVNAVERLLEQAVLRQTGAAVNRVYVLYRPVDSEPAYRSEVLEGRVVWSKDPGLRRLGETAPTVQVAVIWQRRYFWEGDEAVLPGATITNGDGGTGNVITWNTVRGTLPAPVRLTLTNASGTSLGTQRFYVQNDVTGVFAPTGAFLYPLPAQASGSWVAGFDHDDLLWPLAVPAAIAARLQGERYRMLAAFDSIVTGVYLRAAVYAVVSGVYLRLQAGPEVLVGGAFGGRLLDLGALNLPPAGAIGSPASYAIVVTVSAASSGTATLRWLHLAPALPSLTLTQQGYLLGADHSIVHDGIEGVNYAVLSQRQPIVEAAGELILHPGRTNRIAVLFDEGVVFEPSRQLTVTGVYRPRRLTV